IRASWRQCGRQAAENGKLQEQKYEAVNMQPFEYSRANDPQSAISGVSEGGRAKFLAGGTNLTDLMKQHVELPTLLVDIRRLELSKIEELPDGGLRLGALATNADTANHEL